MDEDKKRKRSGDREFPARSREAREVREERKKGVETDLNGSDEPPRAYSEP